MNKLIAALVAGLFATAAFAQASGTEAPVAASGTMEKKATKHHHAKKHSKKAAEAASGASM